MIRKMEEHISFNIDKEDKKFLEDKAKAERMPLSTYCRNSIIKFAIQKEQKNPLPDYKQFVERREESH